MVVYMLGAVTATGVANPAVNGVATSTVQSAATGNTTGGNNAATALRGSDAAPTDFSRNGISNRTAAPSGPIADATIEPQQRSSTCESLGSNCTGASSCPARRCSNKPTAVLYNSIV